MTVPRKIRCHVAAIVDHGEHVYTVELDPEDTVPRFRPGQFLHLALDEYDPSGFWPDSRAFSIANSPSQREKIRISYSVQGRFTARMEQELEVGKPVWVKMPYGEFVIQDSNDVVLFAGGTGITAFTAFLEGLTPDFRHRVYLAYGARSRDLLIYRNLVAVCARSLPQFRAYCFVERDGLGEISLSDREAPSMAEERIPEYTGILSVQALWPHIHEPRSAHYYISGPPRMLESLSRDLRKSEIPAQSIHIDAWE